MTNDFITNRWLTCLSLHTRFAYPPHSNPIFPGGDQRTELAFTKQIEKNTEATSRDSEGTR